MDFIFRTQPLINTPDGILLDFLNAEVIMSKKEAIMTALSPLWLSKACQNCQKFPQSQLSKIVKNSIARIDLHLHYLQQTFGINLIPKTQTNSAPVNIDDGISNDRRFDLDLLDSGCDSDDLVLDNWQ